MALLAYGATGKQRADRAREAYGSAPKEHPSMLVMTKSGQILGSHMPLDTGMHWSWRNPLNLIPALLLLLAAAALVGSIV